MKKQFSKKLLLICTFVLALDVFLQYQLYLQHKNNQILAVSSQLAEIRAQLENRITSNLLLAKGIANFFAVQPEVSQKTFQELAENTTNGHRLLKNIGVAQDYIIRYVYPLAGNEKALGLDYRTLPDQWDQVRRVAETGQLVVSGPLHLVQGGYGLIGRVPILKRTNDREHFWGLASVVIDIAQMLAEIGLPHSALKIAIRGVDGFGSQGDIFWGDHTLFLPDATAVTMTVSFPGGEWQLAGQPAAGWLTLTAPPLAYLIHLLLLLFAVALSYAAYRSTRERDLMLQARQSLDEAQAIAHLGSWRLNLKNQAVWWSDESYRIFGKDPGTFKPTYESSLALMHPEDRGAIVQGLESARETGSPYALDHRIVRSDGTVRHVQGRGQVHYGEDQTPLFIYGTLLDITERKKAEQALQASEEMNRAIVEASLDALVTVNDKNEITFWSTTSQQMFGWTADEALGKKLHQLIFPEEFLLTQEELYNLTEAKEASFSGRVQDVVAKKKDGTRFPADLSVATFRLGDSFFTHCSLRDTSERKAAELRLRHLATTDELTNISNRRHFIELAERELKRSQRYGTPFSVVLFDADHFKRVNDTYGHDIGDQVLKTIAAASATMLRELDILGRFGGEEFTVALPQTDITGAQLLAERLRLLIGNTPIQAADGRDISITISLGIAEATATTSCLDELLKHADIALYRAKNNGRNRVETFS